MAKITVCDICLDNDVLKEAKHRISLRGMRGLRLDLCNEHKNIPPKNTVEYVRFVYKVCLKINLTKEQAERMLKSR